MCFSWSQYENAQRWKSPFLYTIFLNRYLFTHSINWQFQLPDIFSYLIFWLPDILDTWHFHLRDIFIYLMLSSTCYFHLPDIFIYLIFSSTWYFHLPPTFIYLLLSSTRYFHLPDIFSYYKIFRCPNTFSCRAFFSSVTLQIHLRAILDWWITIFR